MWQYLFLLKNKLNGCYEALTCRASTTVAFQPKYEYLFHWLFFHWRFGVMGINWKGQCAEEMVQAVALQQIAGLCSTLRGKR